MGRGAVSVRHRPNQFELFPDAPVPPKARRGLIAGLALHLDRHCDCGAMVTVIVEGKGPHAAALECSDCGRFRQWVPRKVIHFLIEIYEQINRVLEPRDGAFRLDEGA